MYHKSILFFFKSKTEKNNLRYVLWKDYFSISEYFLRPINGKAHRRIKRVPETKLNRTQIKYEQSIKSKIKPSWSKYNGKTSQLMNRFVQFFNESCMFFGSLKGIPSTRFKIISEKNLHKHRIVSKISGKLISKHFHPSFYPKVTCQELKAN